MENHFRKRKIHNYEEFEHISDAVECLDKHPEWNVVSIYATGFRNNVCVVYYVWENP
jgi:hypothetical protein